MTSAFSTAATSQNERYRQLQYRVPVIYRAHDICQYGHTKLMTWSTPRDMKPDGTEEALARAGRCKVCRWHLGQDCRRSCRWRGKNRLHSGSGRARARVQGKG